MIEEATSIISALAALVAVTFSLWAHHSAERSRKRADALEEKNAQLFEAQTRLAHQSWSDEYFREITQWACQVSTALSVAVHIIETEKTERKLDALITLSACIDMGRWYFPNIYHEERGRQKEPAYRGIRQPILDWIVRGYDILAGQLVLPDPRQGLVECQRQFVSRVQERLDPRAREQMVGRVLQDYLDVAKLRISGDSQ